MSASEMYTPKSSKAPVASYDQKSGTVSVTDYVKIQGGLPDKKSVDAIDKENMPKTCPSAIGK